MAPPSSAIAGARLYLRHDLKGAVQAWRPLIASDGFALPPTVFDAVGDHDAASKADAMNLESKTFAGIAHGEPREAERALARGDVTTARLRAQKVVDAWSGADTEIPAVRRMRQLLERTKHAAASPAKAREQ